MKRKERKEKNMKAEIEPIAAAAEASGEAVGEDPSAVPSGKMPTEKPDNAGKKKKGKRWIWAVFLTVLLAGGAIAGFWLYKDSLVYKENRVEAGVAISVGDFLKRKDESACFAEGSDTIDSSVPGKYNLKIKTGYVTCHCVLTIEDTIAPEVEVQPVNIEYGETCAAEDFVKNIADATEVTVSFAEEPDFTMEENQKVRIAVTDAGNNTTIAETEMTVSLVAPTLTVEAGSKAPVLSDFVLVGTGGKLITDVNRFDYSKVSSHNVSVELNGINYTTKMDIVDTVPPVFTVKDIEGYAIVERKPEDFVVSAEDVTEITWSFEEEPDFTLIGTQEVTIIAEDEGGNQAKQTASLTLKEDTEPPTITGAADMTVFVKAAVLYKKNVTAQDNCEEGLVLSVDSSAVNINVAGTYPVTYTATDCAGNSTSVSITLTVKERVYDENEVNAAADSVLAGILSEGMSQHDKALAIFNYVKRHVHYVNSSAKGNWVRAAYEGLVEGRGDCYVYACTSKVLLTRAGIPNMDIERIPSGTSMHYWNLVDIGDGWGWYHFDTTPRQDHPTIFLWNDAQITDYSNRHHNCHNYDRSLYPVIN